jgi:hypothetical protein
MQDSVYYWDDKKESLALDKIGFNVKRNNLAMIVGRVSKDSVRKYRHSCL